MFLLVGWLMAADSERKSQPICICGDYSRTLNQLIDRDSYTLPRIEQILHRIAGAIVYPVLDLKDAYLQVNLSEENQKLTCIPTHLGHFAFKKLQFGISAAPLIFLRSHRQDIGGHTLCQCSSGRYNYWHIQEYA